MSELLGGHFFRHSLTQRQTAHIIYKSSSPSAELSREQWWLPSPRGCRRQLCLPQEFQLTVSVDHHFYHADDDDALYKTSDKASWRWLWLIWWSWIWWCWWWWCKTSVVPRFLCWSRHRKFDRAGLLLISESSITVAKKTCIVISITIFMVKVSIIIITFHHYMMMMITWRPASLLPREAGSRFDPTRLFIIVGIIYNPHPHYHYIHCNFSSSSWL